MCSYKTKKIPPNPNPNPDPNPNPTPNPNPNPIRTNLVKKGQYLVPDATFWFLWVKIWFSKIEMRV